MVKRPSLRGYEDWMTGLSGSLLIGCGFFGTITNGFVAAKTGKIEETAKISFCLAGLVGMLLLYSLRSNDMEAAVVVGCSL